MEPRGQAPGTFLDVRGASLDSSRQSREVDLRTSSHPLPCGRPFDPPALSGAPLPCRGISGRRRPSGHRRRCGSFLRMRVGSPSEMVEVPHRSDGPVRFARAVPTLTAGPDYGQDSAGCLGWRPCVRNTGRWTFGMKPLQREGGASRHRQLGTAGGGEGDPAARHPPRLTTTRESSCLLLLGGTATVNKIRFAPSPVSRKPQAKRPVRPLQRVSVYGVRSS